MVVSRVLDQAARRSAVGRRRTDLGKSAYASQRLPSRTVASDSRRERTDDDQQGRQVTAEAGRVPTTIVDILAGMAIARMPLLAIDCPDPGALAGFYGAMLDWKIDDSTNPASVCAENGQCIAFHQVAGYTPPTWPTQDRPQQMHLDLLVDDLDAAEAAVTELGATKHPDQTGTSYRVFLDPAGHPFCLCVN
jgi:predicted enzyme related to lactoylglutathione lyase